MQKMRPDLTEGSTLVLDARELVSTDLSENFECWFLLLFGGIVRLHSKMMGKMEFAKKIP